MIVKEIYRIREDGKPLIKTYSDLKKIIRKIGTDELYSEAIDVLDYEYEETDQLIEEPEDFEVSEQDF
jgi:hypothetical protein